MNNNLLNINNNFIFDIIDNDIKKKLINNINTRFAPDPNGYLHIGHAKCIFINFIIAKRYNGIFNIRFDDTNPSNFSSNYVKNIKKDIRWLNFHWDNEQYTSDYFNNIFNFAIELVKKGLAYVDETDIKNFKNFKGDFNKYGINSLYRNRSISENIDCFFKMKNGFYKENEACLRAKIDMKSSNIIMRDPVLYRIKYINHFRTKKNWCIYPTYDFSNCICDSLENITYSLCTLEFQNNRILYNWILNSLELENKPSQYEFAKLEIEYFLLSKRKLNLLIKNNIVKNWKDPRMPTISGLRNKGYTSDSIIEFCKNIGITKKNSILKIKYLEKILKKDLDKKSIRIMSVINPIILNIYNYNKKNEFINTPNNPKDISLGFKKILFSKKLYIDKNDFYNINNNYKEFIGNILKLRYSYIIKILSIKLDIKNNLKEIFCKYYPNTMKSIYFNNIKINKIIHWVSYEKNFKSIFLIYKNIFNNPLINNENLFSTINNNSLIIKKGYTEKSSKKIYKKLLYQFERIGYFNIKKINYKESKIIFNQILSINDNFYL